MGNLTFENGVYKLPVNLNGVMTLNFTLDLGASDISLSPDVFLVLYRAGTINELDFIGTETYKFADGSTAKSNVFNLKTVKIEDNKRILNSHCYSYRLLESRKIELRLKPAPLPTVSRSAPLVQNRLCVP